MDSEKGEDDDDDDDERMFSNLGKVDRRGKEMENPPLRARALHRNVNRSASIPLLLSFSSTFSRMNRGAERSSADSRIIKLRSTQFWRNRLVQEG